MTKRAFFLFLTLTNFFASNSILFSVPADLLDSCGALLVRLERLEVVARNADTPRRNSIEKFIKEAKTDLSRQLGPINAPKDISNFTGQVTSEANPRAAMEPSLIDTTTILDVLKNADGLRRSSRDLINETKIFESKIDRSKLKEALRKLVKDDDIRALLTQQALRELRQRSALENQRIVEGNRKVDVFIIGAGLAEGNMQGYFRQEGRELDVLTAESTSEIMSTFARGDATFNLNSPSRKINRSSLRQVPRRSLAENSFEEPGDLNFLPGGIVQVNQFETRKYPLARSWAEAGTINRVFSKNNVVFGKAVARIEKEENGEKNDLGKYPYRIVFTDGTSVLSRAVVDTGLGQTNPNGITGLSDSLFDSSRKSLSGNPPQVMTFESFLQYARNSSEPLKPFINKSVAVVGDGDSGKVTVRFLLGLADSEAYKKGTRDGGEVKAINWFGQECKDCETYIQNNRAYYADLSQGYRSKKLIAKEKANIIGYDGTNPYVQNSKNPYDYVIVAAGLKSMFPQLLDAKLKNGLDNPTLTPVNSREVDLGMVGIAQQVDNAGKKENIFLVGPAARAVVSKEELAGVPENSVANSNHNWRAWRLAEALTKQLKERDEVMK